MKQQKDGFSKGIFRALMLFVSMAAFTVVAQPASAAGLIPPHKDDPHRTDVGFFDMHLCYWPDRPPFFLNLFSTTRFEEVASVEIFFPDGTRLGELNLAKYRQVKKKNKPEKRVFITNITAPDGGPDGWYLAHITLKDGRKYLAKNYMVYDEMESAKNLKPTHQAEIPVPTRLSWDPVPGAKYYKVYLKDLWDDGKIILQSKLLQVPRLVLPKGLLKPDGWYAWKVNARDVNEHKLLGDYNHGSLSEYVEFTTLP